MATPSDDADHRLVRMPAAQGSDAGGRHRRAAATDGGEPEKRLNLFVRAVALIERTGNALGTLAFTWATVVLLGGSSPDDDFWLVTTIVFLEAARMFSRDNRPDYQLFFRTRGAFRSLGLNGLALVVCFSDVLAWLLALRLPGTSSILIAIFAIVPFSCREAAGLLRCSPLEHGITLWSPMVAILLMAPSLYFTSFDYDLSMTSGAKWIMYSVLLVIVLLLIISRLRFPSIVKLLDSALGRKLVSWRPVIISLCMFASMVILRFTFSTTYRTAITIYQVFASVVVSSGNLQIPAAVLRVGIALPGLINHEDPTLSIFYVMVVGQGILYIAAGILEVFSFILRRSLVLHAEFRGHLGVEHVNLYYAYAFEKCMRGAVLAPKKISLIRFAMDSLELDSPKMQLCGVQMLHSLLKKEPFKTKAISKLTTSMKTVTSLFNMLGWTSDGDKDIRSYATKVTAELADSLRIAPIPGAMHIIASLLDTVHQPEIKDPLLGTDRQEEKHDSPSQQVSRDEQKSSMLKWLKQMAIYCLIPVEEPSNNDEQNSNIPRCWKQKTKWWSVSEEEPSTNQDLLPVLAMSILERLASFDLENCMEISRATGLISKIIEYTSNKHNMTSIDETQQTLMKGASLKVLSRLASSKGKSGVTLRQKISEHPFVLSNLSEILHDSRSSQEHRELTAEILRNLAIDGNTRAEIGHIRGIISRLMHAFLSQHASSSTDSEPLLRKIAGQALAVLAMECVNNCLVMLAEPGYVFIEELTVMTHSERYRYIAASLLRNMCLHGRPELSNSNLKELSHILPEVLAGIMNVEGAELEILVGLSSQICNVIPEDFAQELEHGQIKEIFIARLVNTINANATPTSHFPGIRRVIVEHAIYMMECNPSYTNCFNKCQMMEALLMVEHTPSRAENYRFFSGDAGLMEHSVPLSALVARAKELIGRE